MSALETRIPPPLYLVTHLVIVWAIDRADIDGSPLAGAVGTTIGLVLIATGVAVALAGIARFRELGTTVDPHHLDRVSRLATSGIYRITRNPMYLGMVLVLFGWGAVLGSIVAPLIGVALFVALLTRLQIMPEERMLDGRFGVTYQQYRQRVRRWI